MQKIWQQKKINKTLYKSLIKSGKSPLASMLVSSRNFKVNNAKELDSYINASCEDIEDPDLIPDMVKFKSFFHKSQLPDTIVVFGDYDVDGTISTFMMRKFLREIGVKNVKGFTPDRARDGYGLNPNSLENFIKEFKDQKLDYIILMDCGTNSAIEIDGLKAEFGCKVLVVDHHLLDANNCLHNCDAIISNRLENCTSTPYCTGGLAYQFIRAMSKEYKINTDDYIIYGAITTIADLVEFDGNNRTIVSAGLQRVMKCKEVGLHALYEVCQVNPRKCTTVDIGFRIGPRINANGRMESAMIVADLLEAKDRKEAMKLAVKIDMTNNNRREIQKVIFQEALEYLEMHPPKNSILIYNESWNPGVVGIVASKLIDIYNVPTMVFGGNKGNFKGSARSLAGINVKEVMDRVSHIFDHHGGHEMAAGAQLCKEHLDDAWDIFDAEIQKYKKENEISVVTLSYDVLLPAKTFKIITDSFCDKVNMLAPFGMGNETPLFRVNNVNVDKVFQWKSNAGGFVIFEGLEFDCFVYMPDAKENLEEKNVDILFEIGENFKDGKQWALIIKEFKVNG
jgi:single-stranded-DNA-specific exonuclease